MEPLLTNERAQREWKYLCQYVGERRARAAIAQLKGGQRAYPLNIARILKIDLPEESLLPISDAEVDARREGRDQGSRALSEMRKLLRRS